VAGASRELSIPAGGATLRGTLEAAPGGGEIVVFVHGSGSSRRSPRNQLVARCMQQAGLGTLLFDLLTADEERIDAVTRHLRFDIELLVQRLLAVTDWLVAKRGSACQIGYFGASMGAAAALVAATRTPHPIAAIVSRGGRTRYRPSDSSLEPPVSIGTTRRVFGAERVGTSAYRRQQ
jgi:dienelactone hydrolase